jgi:hypothetical protein
MKRGDLITIDRDWSSYLKGDRFRVVTVVDVGNNTKNVRCLDVKTDEMPADAVMDDIRNWRTLPGEYCLEVPQVGDSMTINANQGDRDATVLAVLGQEMLIEYDMPAGKTFLWIQNFITGLHRSISRNALPLKWRKELEA